ASRSLVPVGCVGELYVGGAGVALGYLNKPTLSEKAFISGADVDVADVDAQAVLYKTGDKVRWLESGDLEYLGRDDKQVKLRGYRIELEEIESVLMAQDNVQHALVQVKAQGEDASLVAYVVAQEAASWDESRLVATLKSQLASYQLPSHWVLLPELPLTANGKLDLAGLPEVDFQTRAAYVGPRNEVEACLCDIWSDLLSVSKVSIFDDFFKLGGNSIHAVRMAAKIREVLALEFSLAALFEHKTIAELAANLGVSEGIEIPSLGE
ncbi:phosphopantetheine-binding protein, partial [Pseudoalteromonas aurantia]